MFDIQAIMQLFVLAITITKYKNKSGFYCDCNNRNTACHSLLTCILLHPTIHSVNTGFHNGGFVGVGGALTNSGRTVIVTPSQGHCHTSIACDNVTSHSKRHVIDTVLYHAM